MKYIYLIFISYSLIGQLNALFAQPKIELNTCPFEGCQFGQWVCRDTLMVYEFEGDTTSFKFLLTENDTITSLFGNVHYEKFGTVLITQAFQNYSINDTIIVLRCTEGEFISYYKGEMIFTDIFWPIKHSEFDDHEEAYDSSKHKGIMLESPQLVWWVKITWKDKKGWLCLKNKTPYCFYLKERIDGMDIFR